jgi:hypothetical protein
MRKAMSSGRCGAARHAEPEFRDLGQDLFEGRLAAEIERGGGGIAVFNNATQTWNDDFYW